MCAAANDLGRILLDAYSLRLCLHLHADSHIQTQQKIEHFLVELPAGIPDPTASISGLDSLGVPIFVMAEQDRYPCAADVPLPVAIRSLEFPNGCDMNAWPAKAVEA